MTTITRSPLHAAALSAVLAVLSAAGLAAQQSGPKELRIGYVYPAGGQQGSTFRVTLGGQFLAAAHGVVVSGSGVQSKVLEQTKPLTMGEYKKVREQLDALLKKQKLALRAATSNRSRKDKDKDKDNDKAAPAQDAWTPADEKKVADLKRKAASYLGKKVATPAICETVTLELTIAADAEPGVRELRLNTSAGLSNPLAFHVGTLPEFTAPAAKPQGISKQADRELVKIAPTVETEVAVPSVINGQITPGKVDRYRFTARAGQKLVVAAAARALIPYLPDAVPGWFQATLALYDAAGRELAYDDDFSFEPDPVLYYVIPADGQYAIEIKDAVYRGREDFVYRISLGELPFVTAIFPLGGPLGGKVVLELSGWNLPAATLTVEDRHREPGIYRLASQAESLGSAAPLFAVDTLPELLESEPNDQPQQAQSVTLPLTVNGRIDKPDDCDVFRFEGRAGQKVVAEVLARRLNSPLDSVLTLTTAAGEQLATNDDHEDKASGLITHQADSLLRVTLPADGTYLLYLRDVEHNGGSEYAYRLRISGPRPDFSLRVAPSSINARPGTTVALTVYALRSDGFTGAIDVALKDAPPGLVLGGARIPPGQEEVPMTLTVPAAGSDEPLCLKLEGRAEIDRRQVVHAAVPAEDMMQAFAYRHLVPAHDLDLAVLGGSKRRSSTTDELLHIARDTRLEIPAGGTARLPVAVPKGRLASSLEFKLSNAPDGICVEETTDSPQGVEIVLRCDAEQVRPGMEGNLIVTASAKSSTWGKSKTQTSSRTTSAHMLPAVPFKILKAK